jgi:predicted HicB family RNase H-like nuclease
MGRPRENDAYVLTEILNLRMSEQELLLLRLKASAEKISVGAYVRQIIRRDLNNA